MGASVGLPKSITLHTESGDVTLGQSWVVLLVTALAALLLTLALLLQVSLASQASQASPGIILWENFPGFAPRPVYASETSVQPTTGSVQPSNGSVQPFHGSVQASSSCIQPLVECKCQCLYPPQLESQSQEQPQSQSQSQVHLYGMGIGKERSPLFPANFTPFTTVFNLSRSDKRVHAYGSMYAEYLDPLRLTQPSVNLLEIGLRDLDSVALWLRAFPKGRIYGLEFNPKAWEEVLKRPNVRKRVKVFTGDQANVALLKKVVRSVKREVGLLDFIVDDGGHSMEQQIVSFTHLMPLVKPGGVYFIEDLQTSYWSTCHHHFNGSEYCYGGGAVGKKNTTIDLIKSFIDVLNSDFIEDHPENMKYKFGTGVYHVNPSDKLIGSVQCWRNMCAFRRKYENSCI